MRPCSASLCSVVVLFSGVSFASCADEDAAALALELVTDTDINGPDDVLRSVKSVVLVVDSDEGLYPSGAERTLGDVRIEDADGDPSDLELVALVPIQGARLPSIRLQRGGLPDVPITVRVLGMSNINGSGSPIATGYATNLRFMHDAPASFSIPFNLLPRMLPPRVTRILPAKGETLAKCDVDVVIVAFSKAVDPKSLMDGHIRIESKSNGRLPIQVNADGAFVQLTTGRLDTGEYTVHVSSDVTDLDGLGFDQIGATEGAQPLTATFGIRCDYPFDPNDCGVSGAVCCPGPEDAFEHRGIYCRPTSCDATSCPGGYVCDPATAMCEVDCRIYDSSIACPLDQPSCDGENGLCVAEPSR